MSCFTILYILVGISKSWDSREKYMYVVTREDRIYRRRHIGPLSWKKFTFPETDTTAICGGEGELTAG